MKMKDREHKVAVQEKELRIRELEVELKQKESLGSSGDLTDDIIGVNHLAALYETLEHNDVEETCRSHWRDVGSQLGFSTQELDGVQNPDFKKILRRSLASPLWAYYDDYISESSKCMINLLRRWLQQYPNDRRGSTSFPRYQSLKKALMNAGFGNVVSNLWSYQDIVAAVKEYQSQLY